MKSVNMKKTEWTTGMFIILYHCILLVSLPLYLMFITPSTGLIITTVVLFLLCGIGITAGYHRFYSHNAYTPSKVVEVVLLFLGTLAVESTVLKWAHNHRLHTGTWILIKTRILSRKGFGMRTFFG